MRIRVYYEDTDCGGVVYYANYLKYMERGRTEYLRERCVNLADYHSQGLFFAVIEVSVKYRRPARYNDLLLVETSITDAASIMLEFKTDIRGEQGELLVAGVARLACMNDRGKASRIPAAMREALGVSTKR
jgi:acyl-CoA thioester hydrolase